MTLTWWTCYRFWLKSFFKRWFLNQEVASESPWSFFKMHMPLPTIPPTPPPPASWTTRGRVLAGVFSAGSQATLTHTSPASHLLPESGHPNHLESWLLLMMQWVWGRAWDSVFLTSSRVMSRLLVQRRHWVLTVPSSLFSAHRVHTSYEKENWNYVLTWNWFHLFLLCLVFMGCL